MTRGERVLWWIASVNFMLFAVAVLALGGDAIRGMSFDGGYFLGLRGSFIEVCKAVYFYSYIHALSLVLNHPLAIGAGFNARERTRSNRIEGASAE